VTWLAFATTQDDFSEVLAQRLRRDENEVLSLRFEQDMTDSADAAASVCARHSERAHQLPENADWRYIAIRCEPDSPARDDAFVEAHEANPNHPWTAGAAGYTYAGRGEWADAQSALDNAFSNLPAMRISYVDDVARVRRMQQGVPGADLADLAEYSQWLQAQLEIENPYGDADPVLKPYVSLAGGELNQAIKESAAADTYADEILRLAAASDGASQEMIRNANELSADLGVSADTVGVAIGLAHRTGAPTERLLARIDPMLGNQASYLHAFYAVINDRVLRAQKAEDTLIGADPVTRGRAYAMGAVALGSRAPRSWRDASKRLLFVTERPYFF